MFKWLHVKYQLVILRFILNGSVSTDINMFCRINDIDSSEFFSFRMKLISFCKHKRFSLKIIVLLALYDFAL